MGLLDWRWGPDDKLGLGATLGLLLVVVSLLFIALDLTGVTRQVEPPPFLKDFVPDRLEVCTNFPASDPLAISWAEESFVELGWPAWPKPESITCNYEHEQAPRGVVRWHSCDSILVLNGELESPCPVTERGRPNGRTWAQSEDGVVIAVDIYVQGDALKCTVAHEMGHARGLLLGGELESPRGVTGAHTDSEGHLMSEFCGSSWRWLDRTPDGDWPY